ncbi:MAG: kdsD 2 [Deltaproteobacteria bacterium]|nr:kdsD 2 [Deltaproteobacteria bacterium]
MPVGDYCRRDVGTINGAATLAEAGKRMKEENTGCLVMLDLTDRPCGLVTDRDLALRALCGRLDASTATLDSIVPREDPVAVSETTMVRVAIGMMRKLGVRRLLVRDAEKRLVGMVLWDDLIGILAQELAGLAATIGAQAPHAGVPRSRALTEVLEQ